MDAQTLMRSFGVAGAGLLVTCALAASTPPHLVFQPGDLIVGGQNSEMIFPKPRLDWFLANGTLNSRLVDSQSQGYPWGVGFSRQGRLFVTLDNRVHAFDGAGHNLGPISNLFLAPAGMAFDAIGNLYVGGPGQAVTKLAPDGTTLHTFAVASDGLATGWPGGVDLAADQCTVHYTIGRHVMRFDVCRNVQLSPLNSTPLPGAGAFGLRLLPDGRVLVAAADAVYLLGTDGSVLRSFDAPGEDSWSAVALDVDGASFWSGSGTTVYRFSVAGGPPIFTFQLGDYGPGALAVLGEPRAAYVVGIPMLSARAKLVLALVLAACGLSIARRSA